MQLKHYLELNNYLETIQENTDKIIDKFLIVFFIFGLFLAPIDNTWAFSLITSFFIALLYGMARFIVNNKFYSRMIISAVLAIFVLQYIAQTHGRTELYFFFFTNITLLIFYQNWRIILPYLIVMALHYIFLAFFQSYVDTHELALYFANYTDITFLEMVLYFSVISLVAYIAILCAVMLNRNSKKLFQMNATKLDESNKSSISEIKFQEAFQNIEKEFQRQTLNLTLKTEEILAKKQKKHQNLEEINKNT